jgi:hypothetical protein
MGAVVVGAVVVVVVVVRKEQRVSASAGSSLERALADTTPADNRNDERGSHPTRKPYHMPTRHHACIEQNNACVE